MKRIVIVMFAVLYLSACGAAAFTPTPAFTPPPDPCSKTELAKYLEAINAVSRRFDDAATLAQSTPRMNLPPIISDLQGIRRDM